MRFVDTNVLLYAISSDPDEAQKAEIANELLGQRDLALSVQVLQEFYVQATRASRPDPIRHDDAVQLIGAFQRFPVTATTPAVLTAALATRSRFQVSLWDATLLESARVLGCTVVLTEDLSDGMDYGGVTVQNPFRGV